jgi:hypothetical protein
MIFHVSTGARRGDRAARRGERLKVFLRRRARSIFF